MKPKPLMAYAVALAVGLSFVVSLFPAAALFPADFREVVQWGDRAQGMVAQRYVLASQWGWPPLDVDALAGVNVALADSLPLALLLLKPFRAWLPPGFYLQEIWIALAWLLQPAAAVYALRGAGVQGWPGTLAVAALSLLPTLLARFGHTALCTHALILLAIGLYLRLIRTGRGWWACVPLLLASLLVHPYLMAMVAAVLTAGPLSLLLAGQRWWPAAAWLALAMASTGDAAIMLGFGGAVMPPGYGYFSMNLLAPFAPSRTTLFPDMTFDATGGQSGEGYQYLGAGLLALLAVAGVMAASGRGGVRWRRHAGLLLVLPALTLFAASGIACLGPYRLLDLGDVPAIVQQFRSTGRFFWPVAYALLIGAVTVVARGLPSRPAALVLLGAVVLQAADMPKHWNNIRVRLEPQRWVIDAPALSPIIAAHDRVTLWPTYQCGVDDRDDRFMQLLLLASNTLPQVNTMYVARRSQPVLSCDAAAVLGQPWRPRELRVILPPAAADTRLLVPEGGRLCRRLGDLLLCSHDDPAVLALAP